MRHALDREHREASRPRCSSRCGRRTGPRALLVAVDRPVRMDDALRARSRRCAGTCSSLPMHVDELGARRRAAAPRTGIRDSVSGTGVTAPRIVAGSAPSATATGNGSPGCGERVVAEVERAAAMREPAHDHLVAARSPAGGRCPGSARGLCGPRVTVSPQVISGPASPGQQVCIGSRPRSTSAPSRTTSWQGAEPTLLAAPCRAPSRPGRAARAACPRHRAGPWAARAPCSAASSLPISRSAGAGERPPRRPSRARRGARCRTGCRAPASSAPRGARTAPRDRRRAARGRRSRSSPGAARRCAVTRLSSPSASSWAMNSRRSA